MLEVLRSDCMLENLGYNTLKLSIFIRGIASDSDIDAIFRGNVVNELNSFMLNGGRIIIDYWNGSSMDNAVQLERLSLGLSCRVDLKSNKEIRWSSLLGGFGNSEGEINYAEVYFGYDDATDTTGVYTQAYYVG